MNIILLSGGSGKRLWPLSNDIRSKQFIKIFRTENGYESMVQRVYRQVRAIDPSANITIACPRPQVSSIHNQIGENVGISVEPCRRDTFPAIALAVAYLHDVERIDENNAVVVCPIDTYVDDTYYSCIANLYNTAMQGDKDIVLMGIEPTCPSEKYGYIIPEQALDGEWKFKFTEKPSEEKAAEYISVGALWNGGVFGFKLSYILKKANELLGCSEYRTLYENYERYKKISFDYAVLEHEDSIEVLRYSGKWADIGSWNMLSEVMSESIIGDAKMDEECDNTHIINELDIPILAMGAKNMIISASPDGILVAEKERSGYIKGYIESWNREAMYAEKSWGSFRVIDVEENCLTIKVVIKSNDYMNYHSHEHRDEVWVVVSGVGIAVLDGKKIKISGGDRIEMKAGCKHTVFAVSELTMIEIQTGKDINVHDKIKYNYDLISAVNEVI
jgi:mannose-1-phosphate guanylyltransferase